MPEKVAYLFARDIRICGTTETNFVVYEGSGPGFIDMERPTVHHYRDLQNRGYRIEDKVLPNGFPTESGFRLLNQNDLTELRETEWEIDHPGISVETGKLIERLKQGVRKDGLLWVFDLSFAPEGAFDFPDIQKITYFLMGEDGSNEHEPFLGAGSLPGFNLALTYFKEALNFRNTSPQQAESFRDFGISYNPGIVEHNLGEHSIARYFKEHPPICRPLNQQESKQLSQGGIEVLVETAQPQQ